MKKSPRTSKGKGQAKAVHFSILLKYFFLTK